MLRIVSNDLDAPVRIQIAVASIAFPLLRMAQAAQKWCALTSRAMTKREAFSGG
jgi:hypothetical protein